MKKKTAHKIINPILFVLILNQAVTALEDPDGHVRDHSRRRRLYFGRPCHYPSHIELQLDQAKLLPQITHVIQSLE